jgi:two-component system, NtrC family, response regulator HydG
MLKILIIEDDRTFSRILDAFLSKQQYQVTLTYTGKEGLASVRETSYDLVLLDYRLPDATGMDILKEIKILAPDLSIIIMTSFSDVRTAVKAIKAGAFEYITKPVNPDELLMLIREALKKESHTVVKVEPQYDDFIIGQSERSQKTDALIKIVAPTDLSVIIEGESGTGKEYIARSIHKHSKRVHEPFVAVDCGVLSKELAASELFGHVKGAFTGAVTDKDGQFLLANGGTLFLDEIGNLSYEVQVQLLRAIQERTVQPVGGGKQTKVNVRIITATNDDLYAKTRENKFREDLYHRLNEFSVKAFPLRNRSEDLLQFIEFFREKANHELNREVKSFSTEVLTIFKQHEWPGNLRELKNTIKRAILLTPGNVVEVAALPTEMLERAGKKSNHYSDSSYDLKALQERNERELIMKTLEETRYNKSKTAKMLNIDRKTLYLKMEKYGIE